MNDSLRTDVLVRYQPEAVACACIYLAARRLQIPLPNNPPWYELFRVDKTSIEAICMALLNLYARAKPNYERLEKIVEEARKHQMEAKMRAKTGPPTGNFTPNSNSRAGSPKNVSPHMSLLPHMKKIKTEEDTRSENGSSFSGKMNHNKQKRRHGDSDSRSSRSKSRSSSSRSGSLSPAPKRSKGRSPSRHHKKDRYLDVDDYYSKDKRSHKRKRHARSRSRSLSRSPSRHSSKSGSKKYYKEKRRSPTPEKVHRSRKHRNGHRDSPRDRYDKYRR